MFYSHGGNSAQHSPKFENTPSTRVMVNMEATHTAKTHSGDAGEGNMVGHAQGVLKLLLHIK